MGQRPHGSEEERNLAYGKPNRLIRCKGQKQTMKLRLVMLGAAMLLTANAGLAQTTTTTTTTTTTVSHVWEDPHGWWGYHWKRNPDMSFYNCNELTMDFFGSYIAGERRIEDIFKTNIRHGTW